MEVMAIPVVNGVLPRAIDGLVQGVFLDPFTTGMLRDVGQDGSVFMAPFACDDGDLFPIGVIGRIEALWAGPVYVGVPPQPRTALFAVVRGLGRGRASGFAIQGQALIAGGVREIDFGRLRDEGYPVICGGGWEPGGGTTDQSPGSGLTVEISGTDVSDGCAVSIHGRLEGLVSPYQAHTIEHGIIRSLAQYGLVSPRTLTRSIKREGEELRASVERGFRDELPEVFGVTSSGACGNPLTHLARFFMVRDLFERLKAGDDVLPSITRARKKALSELSDVLRIDTGEGIRIVQGLHRGMRHDDTPLTPRVLARVLARFPTDPWS